MLLAGVARCDFLFFWVACPFDWIQSAILPTGAARARRIWLLYPFPPFFPFFSLFSVSRPPLAPFPATQRPSLHTAMPLPRPLPLLVRRRPFFFFLRRHGCTGGLASPPVHHHHPQFRSLGSQALAQRRKAVEKGAPQSVQYVLDDFELLQDDRHDKHKSPVQPFKLWMNTAPTVRQVGTTRRIHLPSPYLTSDQLEGLAYRIKALTRNDALSSILIANNTDSQSTIVPSDDNNNSDDHKDFDPLAFCLPTTMLDRDDMSIRNESYDPCLPPEPGFTHHVSSGYDPTCPQTIVPHDRDASIQNVLTHVSSLTMALRGDVQTTKIPTIVMPHGMLQDAGFAFMQANYVLATRETSFQFTNPRKGLTFDPVGLSLILPRLGQEFNQPSQNYPCGMVLALLGYQATAEDCLETGLATHYVDTPSMLAGLEQTLSELPPWKQQTIVKPRPQYLGSPNTGPTITDLNAEHRNYMVAETLNCYSDSHASGVDVWSYDESLDLDFSDPSFDTDGLPWHMDRTSDLVDVAATFADIFNEPTLVGIHDRLKEVAHRPLSSTNLDDNEGIEIAQEFIRRLNVASPLALHVTHRLMQLGKQKSQTWASCLAREHRVQAKLLQGPDFQNWMRSSQAGTKIPPQWKYAHLEDVSPDEVLDLVEE